MMQSEYVDKPVNTVVIDMQLVEQLMHVCVDKLVGMVVNKIDAYDDNADDVVREC